MTLNMPTKQSAAPTIERATVSVKLSAAGVPLEIWVLRPGQMPAMRGFAPTRARSQLIIRMWADADEQNRTWHPIGGQYSPVGRGQRYAVQVQATPAALDALEREIAEAR